MFHHLTELSRTEDWDAASDWRLDLWSWPEEESLAACDLHYKTHLNHSLTRQNKSSHKHKPGFRRSFLAFGFPGLHLCWTKKHNTDEAVARGWSRAEGSDVTFALLQLHLESLALLKEVLLSLGVCAAGVQSQTVGPQSFLMFPQIEESVTEAVVTLRAKRRRDIKLWMWWRLITDSPHNSLRKPFEWLWTLSVSFTDSLKHNWVTPTVKDGNYN